jgi:hypothetical protein
MVCFCDIPLSKIEEHAKEYHNYGIGLKKDWGIINGLNPVFYIQEGSFPEKLINSIFKSHRFKEIGNGKLAIEISNIGPLENFLKLTSYLKPRLGYTWDPRLNSYKRNSHGNIKEKTFYNEREWRYVLDQFKTTDKNLLPINFRPYFIYLDDENKFNEDKFNQDNKSLEQSYLEFQTSDLKYIIVSKEDQIKNLSSFIEKLDNYDFGEKNVLKSKIISMTQIKEDF